MASDLDFIEVQGEVAALMRAHDWSASPLGDPSSWPSSLNTIVGFMLASKFPMYLAWGEELACLYNDAYVEILGHKHPSALGQPFKEVWSEVWDDIYPLVRQSLSGESVFHENMPLTMRRKGFDEQTWFTFSYSPVRDESGHIKGMCAICIETTSQVLAEHHRIEENKYLHDLFTQAPGFMAVVQEPSHIFKLTNTAYLRLVGHRDLIGKPVREALPEIEGQGFFELLDQVYTTGEPFVGMATAVRLQRVPEGELEERFVDFVYQPIKDRAGKVTGIFCQGNDVTERIQANQALRESEQQLRQLANTIPQLAWIATPDGEVHWYNDRWYDYTGTTLEQMQGWGWKEVVHPDDMPIVMEEWQTALATGGPYELPIRVRSSNGEFRIFSVRAAPLHDASGNIVQWFGTNTDVTDLKKLQDELEEAGRRKDEFLALLAHELRNPLAPISTAADLLGLFRLDEERVRNISDIISRQVAHMRKLVDDLLDVSRVTRGLVTLEKETLDLKTVVADAVEQARSLINEKFHQLELQVPDRTALVKGDRVRLTQVLTNVLNNAAKYTPERGHITVSVENGKEHVHVVVKDNGVGMESDLLPHVFGLFSQAERSSDRSQGGLGLGLALVKSLVELHGGTVTAYSEGVGKGSTFTIRLPKAEALVRKHSCISNDSKAVQTGKSLRVLVVDDNLDAAHTLSMLLEALGHKVLVEHTAQQALQRAQREKPELLLLDIGMPGMDGYELAKKLRKIPEMSRSVLVAVTGYGQKEDRDRALSAGFDHHLVKPTALDKLADLIDSLSIRQ